MSECDRREPKKKYSRKQRRDQGNENENDDLNDDFMVMIIFKWIPQKNETHSGHRHERS